MAAAPDPRTLLCSLDGDVLPVGEATISITDEGLIRGDGAFEVLKLYDNRPFALAYHLDRLGRSAEGIFLEWDRPAFEQEIGDLLDGNRQHDAELRLILTRGGRRVAIIEAPHTFEHGLSLSTIEYQPTVVLTGLKTLSYEANMTATRMAQRDGAEESRSYKLGDVQAASEVFLASSLREVQGVASLDDLEFTCPGPVTERVAGLL